MPFNAAQRRAIEHKDGPLIVVAGPGSGKTTVVVNRAAKLIEKGVKPENILVITFTKMAAKEMETRFEALTESEYPGITFGTIHSVALNILVNSFGYSYDNVLTEREKWTLLKKLIYENKVNTDDIQALIKNLISCISLIKIGELKEPYNEDYGCRPEQLRRIYNDYVEYCEEHQKIDYDDMQIKCFQLLLENPKELKFWQKQFEYLLVDEFQDVDNRQADFIYLLAKPHNNICIVGDDDQSLYRFRGARPEIMLAFEEKFKAKKILLNTNYRSGEPIVNLSSEFIKANKQRFDKDFKSVRKRGKINISQDNTFEEQAERVAKEIKSLTKKKVPYEEIAVIYRTNRESSKIINAFIEADIPFVAKSENVINLFEHWIFKDIVNFYEVSHNLDHAPFDMVKRALKRPTRYIPLEAMRNAKSLEDITAWGYFHKKSYIGRNIFEFKNDMKILKRQKTLSSFLRYLIEDMGYEKSLLDYAEYNHLNVQELTDVLDEIMDSAKEFAKFEDWYEHTKDYTITLKESVDITQEGVRLLTMHSSKGLEFKHVFIIDANEGYTPYEHKGVIGDEEEERRMFYVAMTRAKECVHISYVHYAKDRRAKASRFVAELQTIMSA